MDSVQRIFEAGFYNFDLFFLEIYFLHHYSFNSTKKEVVR